MDYHTSSSTSSSTDNHVNLLLLETLKMLMKMLRNEETIWFDRPGNTGDQINTWITHVASMETFVQNDRLEYCLTYMIDFKITDGSIVKCFRGGQKMRQKAAYAKTLINRFCANTYECVSDRKKKLL